MKCEHIFAVEFAIQREEDHDGSTTVTQTVTVTETFTKPTYPQDWPAYNAAQMNEKDKFLNLLHDLCLGFRTATGDRTPKDSAGRCPLCRLLQVYSTFSGRRFMSDVRDAQSKGHLQTAPHYNSIFRTLENEELTPILRGLIIESSLPLKVVEADFAVDSSGSPQQFSF